MEVASRQGLPSKDGAQQLYALHGPDASLELSMLRALMQLKEAALPILPALLGPPVQACVQNPPPCYPLLTRTVPIGETDILPKPSSYEFPASPPA